MGRIVDIINEELDELMSQYVDIIDLDPTNPRYDKYKKLLWDKYNYEYQPPETRYKAEIELINKLSNIDVDVTTSKGLDINIKSKKTSNLLKSLTLTVTHNGDIIATTGFNIDLDSNELRIGGAQVIEEYRRQGVYSEIINIITDIAKKYNLNIIESGRSDDAKAFWKARGVQEDYPLQDDAYTAPLPAYGDRLNSIS